MIKKDTEILNVESNPVRWPHRIAILLALIVFPLIWVGGLVTTTDAGMAVPDWPNTYGYNMLAYPVYDWFFGPWDLFVEHGHRLLGTLSGMVSIVLVVVTWMTTTNKRLRWFAWALLAMVVLQGVLGGARVVLDRRDIARIHGCVGPAFFAMVVAFAVMTGGWWARAENRLRSLRPWSFMSLAGWVMLGASYLQLVLGSMVRHVDTTASPKTFSHLVWMHVAGAVIVTMGSVIVSLASRPAQWRESGLRRPITWGMHLVTLQFSLGLATWVVKYGWPAWMDRWGFSAGWIIPEKTFWQTGLVTMHVAIGSMILAAWMVVALRGWRITEAAVQCEMPATDAVGEKNSRQTAVQH